MMDQKSPDQGKQEAPATTQNRPSHMNQGNQTFRPNQQKRQEQDKERDQQKNQQPKAS